jgi:putative ATPase
VAARKRESTPGERTLFEHGADAGRLGEAVRPPLAERMRPKTLDEVVGQGHLLGPNGALRRAIQSDRISSFILWGDPGCGKTTLAHVVSHATRSVFEPFSAVLGGVAELREIVQRASDRRRLQGLSTILFVDEIHRFNRAQQDAFLPHVERGTVTLIGATTENPSFAVNSAVLSRAKVFRLKPLGDEDIERLLRRALSDRERGLPTRADVDDEAIAALARAARGDARRALNQLEALAAVAGSTLAGATGAGATGAGDVPKITISTLAQYEQTPALLYDKRGEEHYNVVSALIKSMRGSDPDAAIYWLMRMLEAGDDPAFVLRRLIIFASEDVGNADPRALQVAVNADQAFHRLGMPEGLYPIAHACLYLASCPKSNSVGRAFKAAQAAIEQHGALPVPEKLRNAVTKLMKAEGYGAGYQYAHDHANHYVAGETYLPQQLVGSRYYEPSSQGLEDSIRQRLMRLRGEGPRE